MVFKCQEDSFLKEYSAKVISCEKATFTSETDVQKNVEGYNVVLNDTILFPEGGGQPCDFGYMNNKPIRNVVRKGSEAVHFVETLEPFTIGEEVELVVDWERRFDHMQQHSGQHLITALFGQEYNFDTKSWWLGKETSYIELNTVNITKRHLVDVEKLANDLIIKDPRVFTTVTTKERSLEFKNMRAPRGILKDNTDPIRIVTIEGIESNMCCGTHVSNLSQLQVIKLLHIEKTKNRIYVHFLVGNRVAKMLEKCYSRELQLNSLLKGSAYSHVDLIQKMQTNLKDLQKNFQKVLADLAKFEADKVKAIRPLPKYYCLHRRDGIEPNFINTFLRYAVEGVFYFLSVSDNSGKGHMVLRGDEVLVSYFGPVFTELLDGKGSSKGSNFQAKFSNAKKLLECEVKINEYFNSNNPSHE